MNLATDDQGRYYDSDRHGTDLNWMDSRSVYWYIVFPVWGGDREPSEELDVLARDKREASAVTHAALERDYEPEAKILRIVQA